MNHIYYPKITTHPANDLLHYSQQWVATEKIHGAQFVIGINDHEIRYGKRKAWLQESEPFFGWQMLRSLFEASAQKLYSAFHEISGLFIYGELFGGAYPHDEVKNVALLTPVQTGIWYSPTIQYAIFDILIIRDEMPLFLSFSEVEKLVATTQLLTVPVIGYGSYNTLQTLPVRYASKIHTKLELPAINNNDAEGFVLKPNCEIAAHRRPVVKYKIPEFSENRFDESQPFNLQSMPSVDELSDILTMMVNRTRIESARSKVGEEIDAIIEESVFDVLVDLESTFPQKMSLLTEHEEQLIINVIEEKVKDCIR